MVSPALLANATGLCTSRAEDALSKFIAVRFARFESISVRLSEKKAHGSVAFANRAGDRSFCVEISL